nr:hypothetical protein [Abalone asfa-like virus]
MPIIVVLDGGPFSGKTDLQEQIYEDCIGKGLSIAQFSFPFVGHPTFALLEKHFKNNLKFQSKSYKLIEELSLDNLKYGIAQIKQQLSTNTYDVVVIKRFFISYYAYTLARRLVAKDPEIEQEMKWGELSRNKKMQLLINKFPAPPVPFKIDKEYIVTRDSRRVVLQTIKQLIDTQQDTSDFSSFPLLRNMKISEADYVSNVIMYLVAEINLIAELIEEAACALTHGLDPRLKLTNTESFKVKRDLKKLGLSEDNTLEKWYQKYFATEVFIRRDVLRIFN